MSRATFNPTYDQLPRALPIFPLPGALLLPGGHLPLNIFEPRYIEMFDAALAGERMIGMVQPNTEAADPGRASVYRTGCAGRITTFSETTDGRYEVTLLGLIRFDIAEELPPKSYRSVRPDFGRFAPDLEENDAEIDRVRLLTALKTYFHAKTIQSDWQAIEQAENDRLVTALAMLCPLESWEKQLLLEAETLDKRAEVLTAILEMAIRGDDEEVLRH
jgi:Lon protease-like protein